MLIPGMESCLPLYFIRFYAAEVLDLPRSPLFQPSGVCTQRDVLAVLGYNLFSTLTKSSR